MKEVTMITGNMGKWRIASDIFKKYNVKLNHIKMDTPEIQADDVIEVSKYSAKWAAEKLNQPVLKNDSGLFVEAFNGFPGVYTHYAEDTIGEDGLLKLMEGLENRNAYFKESIAYCEPGCEPVVFEGITKGRIDTKKSGTNGWSWDYIFIPEGETEPLACFEDSKKWSFWSNDAYERLAQYLKDK